MRPVSADGVTLFEPSLAESPPRVGPGGLDFTIEPNAKWSDGSPVTANDVLASLDRLKKSGRGTEFGDAGSDTPRRLVVALRRTHPDPASLFAFKVTPAGRGGDLAFDRQPIGSGPYDLDPTPPSAARPYVAFRANETSARRPPIAEVRFLESPDPLAELRDGFADLVLEERSPLLAVKSAVAGQPPRLDAGPDARLATVPSRRIYYLAINPIKVALGGDAGRPLRRAIAFCIDREAILNAVWRVKGRADHRALTGPFPPATWPCDPEALSLDDDTLAHAELKSARIPDQPLSLLFMASDPAAQRACELMAERLKAVGVRVEPKGQTADAFTRAVEADRDFDLAYRHFDFADDWFTPTGLFSTPIGGAAAARLDEALARCAARAEFTALRDARRRLHRECREVMPFIPLWTLDVHVVLRKSVVVDPPAERIDPLAPLRDVARWRVSR